MEFSEKVKNILRKDKDFIAHGEYERVVEHIITANSDPSAFIQFLYFNKYIEQDSMTYLAQRLYDHMNDRYIYYWLSEVDVVNGWMELWSLNTMVEVAKSLEDWEIYRCKDKDDYLIFDSTQTDLRTVIKDLKPYNLETQYVRIT